MEQDPKLTCLGKKQGLLNLWAAALATACLIADGVT